MFQPCAKNAILIKFVRRGQKLLIKKNPIVNNDTNLRKNIAVY